MDIKDYYSIQLEIGNKNLDELKSKKSAFGWLRFGAIAGIFFAFYLLWNIGIVYVVAASIILFAVFLYLVGKDITNQNKIKFLTKKIELLQKEIDSLNNFPQFPAGDEYRQKEHPYSDDLDIFGKGSLFQYINRTNSEPGRDVLAGFLKEKSDIATIKIRQEGIKELSRDNAEWLIEFQTTGALNVFTNQSRDRLRRWIDQDNKFLPFKSWKWLRYLLPAAILTVTALYIAGMANIGVFLFALFIMAVISWQINKHVAPIHRQLDEISKQFRGLAESVKLIENRNFKTEELSMLQQQLLSGKSVASHEINLIQKILEKLDLRYNIVISFPLNIFLLWNLQQVLDLEKWKDNNKQHLNRWVDAFARMEAIVSLSIFSSNHREYVFPTVSDDYFHIRGKNIGHPLIHQSKRVDNPINIDGNGKLMLVTGSNMAGKSTYLRSIGINCVLAFCGAPVCAEEFQVSLVSLISSMRIVDDLQESTSTFYAELKKLKRIIDRVNNNEKLLILLDEILRGTNSMDRHSGSKALIGQLIKEKSTAIVATHDLELAKLSDVYPGNILNYHFDVQVDQEELFFDYKLKPGICKSMNASILMKKIGIEM